MAKPELELASVALAELLVDPLAELVADPLLDPLLAEDDPLKVPTSRSPALPGYCADDSDGQITTPPNPATASIRPRIQNIGRALEQIIKNPIKIIIVPLCRVKSAALPECMTRPNMRALIWW